MVRATMIATLLVALAAAPAAAQHEGHGQMDHSAHRAKAAERAGETTELHGLTIPDVEVVTHEGETVRFYRDLVEDRVVAMNFIFTTCTTVCPPMGAIFGQLEKKLGDRLGRDVHLISISVDPTTDTPQRLTEWSAKFGRKPGWTLVTGDKATVDSLLKSLQVFTPDFEDHAPVVLLGNDARGDWTRAYGLAPPDKLAEILDDLSGERREAREEEEQSAALRYFTNVELVNQYGEPMRLYSDLLQGKVVLIHTMFTTCTGICPVMSKSVERIQEHVGDRVGEDVHLLSITVDPETDTPEKMRAFADQFHARRGWYFLTGPEENVSFALRKLGQFVEDEETHQGVMLMGNEPTGLWKKAFGLAGAEELIQVFDSVLHDTGGGTG